MKITTGYVFVVTLLMSCVGRMEGSMSTPSQVAVAGTWQLITGTVIEKGDTAITDYTKNISFIKIINDTHFAFLKHDLNKGKDTAAVFVSGGGSYTLKGSLYTEHLEYCSARNWEGNDFSFNVTIQNDTLIQNGVEKVKDAGVDRINIEKYVRVMR